MATRTPKTNYKYLDRVLKRLVREIYQVFRQYRAYGFDELNVAIDMQSLFAELEELNRQAFLDIAGYYYSRDTEVVTLPEELWLAGILRTPSQVMRYSYDSEVVRKRDRLTEALVASKGDVNEFDKAMRYWTQMSGWFAVEVADAATAKSREDRGVASVMWLSEDDNRVCPHCWALNGTVFPLMNVPPKPHPNCRCITVEV